MQDRYAGDIGDFVKLGLLRAIMNGRQLGVTWYRFPDQTHNKDGRHIGYLEQPKLYAALDPELFAHLGKVVVNSRTIHSLLPMLPKAVSFSDCLNMSDAPVRQRRDWRQTWFAKSMISLQCCDVVFADPDNGIVDNADWRKGRSTFGKQIPLDEVRSLAKGRCAIIYHHNTRRPGGHDVEVNHWLSQIGMPAMAVRATARSPRTFFVVNPDNQIEDRVRSFCTRWREVSVRLHSTDG